MSFDGQESILTMSTEGGSGVEVELGAQASIFEELNTGESSHIRNNKSSASDAESYVGVNKDQAKTTQEKAKDSADYRQQILDAKYDEETASQISSASEVSNVSNVSQIGNRKKNRKKKMSINHDDDNCFDDDFGGEQESQCRDVESVEEKVEEKAPAAGCCEIM